MSNYQRNQHAARERWEQQEEERERKVSQAMQRTGGVSEFPPGSEKARNLKLRSDGSYETTDTEAVLGDSPDAGDTDEAGV